MESKIFLITALLALALMLKIGVLHTFGVGAFCRAVKPEQQQPLRRASGIIIAIAAVWCVVTMLQIAGWCAVGAGIYYLLLAALIVAEIVYITTLLFGAKSERGERGESVVSDTIYNSTDSSLQEVISEIDNEEEIDPTLQQQIATDFEAWITRKGYLDQGVTIQAVASQIKSNRTYLSSYINTTYNTSFRELITAKRIDEAKRILQEEEEITISELAQRIGFSSAASLSRAFTRQEGTPPAVWRSNNLKA